MDNFDRSIFVTVLVVVTVVFCAVLHAVAELLSAKRRLTDAQTDHIIRRGVEL